MRRRIWLALILALEMVSFESLSAQEFPQLLKEDIPDAKITVQKTYEGEGLYGYIDGGAELYMAYGFEKLVLEEVELNAEKYTVLVYKMADPQSAFGIFSLYRYKCDSAVRLTRSECITAYQYLAERNRYYYSIINQSGSKLAKQESLNLAKIFAGKIHPDSIPWPDLFNMDLFIGYQNSLRYIRDNVALQQVLADWTLYFESIKNYSLWFLPVENERTGNFYIALIRFTNATDCAVFIKNSSLSLHNTGEMNIKKEKLGWMTNENSILYFDAGGMKESPDPYLNAIYQFLPKLKKKK
jgi:hypothetical protein